MKRLLSVALMTLVTVSTLTGCYGKFALTRKVYEMNGQVSDKFLRSGLTWVFIFVPVYGVAALVDFVAFNTIEFWSGRNPVAAGEKDFQYVKGGDAYQVHASKSGELVDYTIKHYNKNVLLGTTFINWNIKTGTSVVSTNEGGTAREYVVSKDADKYRIDQYSGSVLENVTFYTPSGAGPSAGLFASAR